MPTSFHNYRWTDANTAEFSSPDEIHVWKIALFDPTSEELGILSKDEIERSQKFKNATARKTYLCSRLVMRRLFASYLKQPSSDFKFKKTQQGKPFLADYTAELKFNLSHSHGLILLAVSPSLELGIDIEQLKVLNNWEKIARKVFDARKIGDLKKEKSPEKAFIRAWTEFEAQQKLLGEGIFGKRPSVNETTASVTMNIPGFEASVCYFPVMENTVISCYNFST